MLSNTPVDEFVTQILLPKQKSCPTLKLAVTLANWIAIVSVLVQLWLLDTVNVTTVSVNN